MAKHVWRLCNKEPMFSPHNPSGGVCCATQRGSLTLQREAGYDGLGLVGPAQRT